MVEIDLGSASMVGSLAIFPKMETEPALFGVVQYAMRACENYFINNSVIRQFVVSVGQI